MIRDGADRAVPSATRPGGTVDLTRHFDIWFGGIFFMIGTAALGGALGVWVLWLRRQRSGPPLWLAGVPLLVGLIFTGVGVGFGAHGIQQQQLETRLLASGVATSASVVALEQTGTRVNGRYLWRVRYEYAVPSGGRHQGVSGYLYRDDAQRYRPGDRVAIRYDPSDPATSIWVGH